MAEQGGVAELRKMDEGMVAMPLPYGGPLPAEIQWRMSICVLYFLRHVDAMQVRCQSSDERVMWLSFCSRSCQGGRQFAHSLQLTIDALPIIRALAAFHFKRIWAFVIR